MASDSGSRDTARGARDDAPGGVRTRAAAAGADGGGARRHPPRVRARGPAGARRPRGAGALRRAMDDVVAAAGGGGPRADRAAARSVCALGGYGRRTLCLHSDIDLLILFDGTIGRDEERFVNAVLQPLWDLQLVVGHQVRELADFDELETDNPEFLLALLDARPLPATPSCSTACRRRVDAVASERPRPRHRRAARADRAAPRAVQRHPLSARAGRQGRARRPARPRGDPLSAHARRPSGCDGERRAVGRPGARRRGLPAAGALGAARRSGPRRQRPHPRAAGAGRRALGYAGESTRQRVER